MSRWWKHLLRGIAIAIGLPVVAALLLYLLSDTGPGRWSIAGLTWLITRGHIGITGLEGNFPNALRARHVEIADKEGVWLVLDDVAIEWKPWGFLRDNVAVRYAHARHGRWLRLPISSHRNLPPDTTRYDVGLLIIDRADFAPWLAGRPFTLSIRASGHYTNENDAQWLISAARLGGAGSYHSEGAIDAQQFTATLGAREPLHGFLSSLAGLPDAGPLSLDARVWGPRSAENLDATARSGAAELRATGGFDLQARTANLDITAHSAAMAPRRDLSWSAFALEGHLRGSFDRPDATGHLSLNGIKVASAGARAISGDLSGHGGAIHFTGRAEGVRMPGREPALLASSAVRLAADARLDLETPQLTFHATHPLMVLNGRAAFGDHTVADASLRLARVAPFAAIGGIDIDGNATLRAHLDMAAEADVFTVEGVVNAAGPALLSRIVGKGAHVAFAARSSDTSLAIDKAHIASPTLTLDAQGSQEGEALAFTYSAKLKDMSRALSTLVGSLSSEGRVQGAIGDFAVTATANGSLATKGYDQGPVALTLSARHLPRQAVGTLQGRGRFDAAPLRLDASFEPRGAGLHHIALTSLEWRSVRANGDFTLPGNFRSPTGHTEFHVAQLADVGLLVGQTLRGALHGSVDLANEGGRVVTLIDAQASDLAVAGTATRSLAITGRVLDPLGKPEAALSLKAGGLSIGGVGGDAQAQLNGPTQALQVNLAADLKSGVDIVPLVAFATLDLDAKKATLAKLETTYRGEPFRLFAPAHVDFTNGIGVDRLELLSSHAEIAVAGRIEPNLAATVTLRNASPELIRIFVPSLEAEGTLSGDAVMSGTLEEPTGTFSLKATGLRLHGEASGLPPATITAEGTLHGTTVSLTAHLDAGNAAHVKIDGTIPLQAAAGFDLKATGTIDLTVFDPVLAANGRRLRGLVSLDGRFTGSFAAPRAAGSAVLSGGEFDDFVQGVRVTNVSSHLQAAGDTITITDLNGRAGRGSISGHGMIALWAKGIPLDLDITMTNARPVATDLFTADLDAKLKLAGRLDETLVLSGTARIERGDINIAESYPSQVAVLDVRRSRNAPPPPTPPKPLSVKLDLVVSAPSRIYVRGRGLEAEAGGTLTVKGSSTAPIVEGGFTMRRGELSLGGSLVRFTSGKITFDGLSLNGSFDPALDFTAESTSGNVSAKLAIGGHASTPAITLTSTPPLPQDEVLAHLLFGRSIAQLNALQLAQIAQAFAALGGFGGGFNPLDTLRRTLGLDRLAVGSAASGTGATIEVGKNLGRSIYVGAKQDTSGGSQAILQVDLTEHLKLQTTVTAVPSAAPTVPTATPQENGSSVGLTYEFEY